VNFIVETLLVVAFVCNESKWQDLDIHMKHEAFGTAVICFDIHRNTPAQARNNGGHASWLSSHRLFSNLIKAQLQLKCHEFAFDSFRRVILIPPD
jgi:hypothetical protein